MYFLLKPLDVLVSILRILPCGLKASIFVCNYGFRIPPLILSVGGGDLKFEEVLVGGGPLL